MSSTSTRDVPTEWLVAFGVLSVAWFAYCLVIMQQILLGLFPVLVVVPLYVCWRFLVALERIADAQQRIADQRDRDAPRARGDD